MCRVYGQNVWILFFYEAHPPQVHVQELYDKFMSSIFLWDQCPHFIHKLGMYRLKGMTSIIYIYMYIQYSNYRENILL